MLKGSTNVEEYLRRSNTVDVTEIRNGIATRIAASMPIEDAPGPDTIGEGMEATPHGAPISGIVTLVPYGGSETSPFEKPREVTITTDTERIELVP